MVEDFNQPSIEDCLILDFDPKFPLKKKTVTEQERKGEVLNILKAIWKDGLSRTKLQNEAKSEMKCDGKLVVNFDIKNKDIKEHEKVYVKQLTVLDAQVNADPDLLSMLVVGFVYTPLYSIIIQ